MRIRWEDFEPTGYEDMVSVLISRLHPTSQRIDGKGGDGGRDVQIVAPEGRFTKAFELKSFTGRMNSNRRQQVKRSLKRAATLKPLCWALVVPIDPTPGELEWFSCLKQEYDFELEWRGRTWLDEKLSLHPDIRRYFVEDEKDEVLQILADLQMEKARINSAPDAIARLQQLHQRLNEIDPYFRYELSTGPNTTSNKPTGIVLTVSFTNAHIDIYEKYTGALQDRPINASVEIQFMPGDDILRENLQQAVDYGLPVTIPSGAITCITIDAPGGLGGSFASMEVMIGSSEKVLNEPHNLTLNLMEDNEILASWPITLTHGTSGSKGIIVEGKDELGWLNIQLTANLINQSITATFRLTPSPIYARSSSSVAAMAA